MQNNERANGCAAEPYETTDFYLACYLRCAGYSLVQVHRQGPRSVFHFADRPERANDTLAFFNNEGSVRPLAFTSAIRDLKALIHNL